MEWQKQFETGHEKIDLEHRVFFDLVQQVGKACADDAPRDKVRRLIAETVKYAEFHFLSEENLMIDVGYPDFEAHHRHHQELMKKLQSYIVSFEAGANSTQELVDFLTKWFVHHTANEDLAISKYIDRVG